MRRRSVPWMMAGLLATAAALPAAARSAPLTAFATQEPVRLGGRSLIEPGNAFFNGVNFSPVTLVYGDHVYVAVRFVAARFGLSIAWNPRRAEVVLGGGTPVRIPSTAALRHPYFSGRFAVAARYLNLSVRGRFATPSGRVVRLGRAVLPDALYADRTMYMPIALLGRALGAAVVWPRGHSGPTAQGGFAVQIAAPLRRLVPGTVLSVQAVVSGVSSSDPLSYHWQLRAPGGLPVPLLDGDSAQSELLALPTYASAGTYRLSISVRDGRLGRTVTTTVLMAVSGHSPGAPGAPPFGYTPETIARAYGVYNVWLQGNLGQGNEIFLYEQQGFNMSDLSSFDAAFGLPAPEISVRPPQSGYLPPGLEATMDVEWVHALAPLARIVVIEDPTQDLSGFPGSLAQSLQTAWFNGSEIASISYGVPIDPGVDSAASSTISALGSQGFSVFAASGDSQSNSPGSALIWPGSDPNVVSVGGTSLFERNPAFFLETYWEGPNGTSSYGTTGAAASYWQRAVSGLARRSVPDVAFDASPRTGVAVYLDGGWWVGGGTSLGAPAWSAIWALCRTDVAGLPAAPLALYAVAQSRYGPYALHNPTHIQFDARTGLGTPNVSELIYALQQIYGR